MAQTRSTRLKLPALVGAVAIAVATWVVLIAGGGSPPAEAKRRPAPPELRSLGSCDGLRAYLVRHRGATRATRLRPVLEMADAAGGAPAAAEAAPESSPTNVQEPGVDEPDVVKGIGSTLFTVVGSTLRAVDVSGGQPSVASSVELPRGSGVGEYELLLAGDRLLAIGATYSYPVAIEGDVAVSTRDVAYPGVPRTVLAEVDVSDPATIEVSRTMTVEGSYVSARLTGSTVRLVSSSHPFAGRAESGHGRALVPETTVRDPVNGARRHRRLLDCAEVRRPSRFAGSGMLSVLTIDLRRGLPAVDADTVLTDGEIVYGSPTALYVATERWAGAAGSSGSQMRTEIHRFDTADAEATEYAASGAVSGHMLGQWSMSEQEGLLRVASTTEPPFDPTGAAAGTSETYVTVLAPDGRRLEPVGRVGGLGRGEQVYAVRFIGDRGYVVTFRQVDPLYVLDLADPTDPRVAGELKIPGYSAYLHPVGPGLLLGIGREASVTGVTGGVQASLFDVSDPIRPRRLDREPFGGGSSSEVESDHHAFAWLADHALALLPIDSYVGERERHLAVGLRVSAGSADPLGRVAKLSAGTSHRSRIIRAVELGGRVYTVTGRGVDAYDPASLAPLGSLEY